MPILSIDQSFTLLGYCVTNNAFLVDFGTIKTNKEQDIYQRAIQISDELISIANKYQPSEIRMEGLAFGMRGNATRDLAGLLFTIITTFRRNNFQNIKVISPKTIKKVATGSGKATKKEMVASLPDNIKDQFTEKGYKISTGLSDLTDSYFLSQV